MHNFRQNKKLQKRILIGAGIIGILLFLSSVGSSNITKNTEINSYVGGTNATANDGVFANNIVNDGFTQDAAVEKSDNYNDDYNDYNTPTYDIDITGDKIIYASTIDIQTLKYKETTEKIDNLITKYKCIIQSETEHDSNFDWYMNGSKDDTGTLYSNLVIRVPSKNFQKFINELEDTGKIVSKSVSAENITKEYNSTEITIESLEVQKDRLLEFMKEADTVSEMIEIETKLTDVERELNQAKSSLEQMETDIEYSYVQLRIDEVYKYDNKLDNNTFFNRLINTIKDSGNNFLVFFENILFGFILMFPYLVIIAIIVFVVYKQYKKRKTRIKEKIEEIKNENNQVSEAIVQMKEKYKKEEIEEINIDKEK